MSDAGRPVGEPAPPGTPSFGSTVTILFSDIRGFTEYTDAYGDEAAYTMLRFHNTLVQEQLALYRGHVVKTQGDSFMVSFDSARTAVTCAIAIQKAIREANRLREGASINIGIGINTGEPVREGTDFFGGTVNLANRICAVAEPGQILVSETLKAVAGKLEGSSFRDVGDFELKGFREPQRLFEVVETPAGVDPVVPPPAPPAVSRPPARRATAPQTAVAVGERAVAPTGSLRPMLSRRAQLIAGVLVVLLLAGTAVYAVTHRGSGVAGSQSVPPFPHGKLLYQAKATADVWSPFHPPTPDPAGSAGVSYTGGAINLNILKPGGNLEGQLDAPALKDFAAQLVMSAAAGSDFEINWWLRATSDSSMDLHINLPTETMSLVWSPNVGDPQVLAPNIRLPGLQSGSRITIGIVANDTHVSIYVNGGRVAQLVETNANGGTNPGFFMDGQSGSLHLESISYYAVS